MREERANGTLRYNRRNGHHRETPLIRSVRKRHALVSALSCLVKGALLSTSVGCSTLPKRVENTIFLSVSSENKNLTVLYQYNKGQI